MIARPRTFTTEAGEILFPRHGVEAIIKHERSWWRRFLYRIRWFV